MRGWPKGKPKSPETIARIKAAMADPKVRSKMVGAGLRNAADPEWRRKVSEGRRRRGENIECPAWVPDDLRERYLKIARHRNEHAAASVIRDLKRNREAAS